MNEARALSHGGQPFISQRGKRNEATAYRQFQASLERLAVVTDPAYQYAVVSCLSNESLESNVRSEST